MVKKWMVYGFCFLCACARAFAEFHPWYNSQMGDPMVRVQLIKEPVPDNSKLELKSVLAYPNFPGPFPAVIVLHDKFGRNSWVDSRALYFSRQGMVGYAFDYLGRHATKDSHANAQAAPLLGNRQKFISRLRLSINKLRSLPFVDPNKIAIIGYGLGATGAIELGLSEQNISGIIASKPLLTSGLEDFVATADSSKILIFHDKNDRKIEKLTNNLSNVGADWELHIYSPKYEEKMKSASSDFRSWAYSLLFLANVFKD